MRRLVFLLFITLLELIPNGLIAQIGAPEHYNIELFMHTMNTHGATVVFNVSVNKDKPIWSPATYLIDTQNFLNPASLVIEGDYTDDMKGWHTDRAERIYDTNPCLQWTYEYKIGVAGKSNELRVETLGEFGWDVDVMYDLDEDKYFYWDYITKKIGDEITGVLKLRNHAEYLQPMPPRHFICTNASHVGQHPYFT